MATKRRPSMRKPIKAARSIKKPSTGLIGQIKKILLVDQFKRFFLSFTPKHFKSYWLSRASLFRLLKLGGIFALAIFLGFVWYAKDLPSPDKLNNGKLGLTTTFYARDELTNPGHGTKLYEVHGDENRLLINFNQMPTTIKQATIAIEDKSFYKEGAFSASGIGRALKGVLTHQALGGGSTITQQYVKNALLTDQRSISRKIKELILSVEINQFYSKDDILKLYLNEIPYSNGAYGIEAACRTYFSKPPSSYGNDNCAQHLDLSQSALLASIPNLPSYYNPYGQNVQELLDRQRIVLNDMAQQGYITQAQADGAKWYSQANLMNKTDGISASPAFFSAVTAPNFVYTALNQLESKYGTSEVEQGGWKVITTLDPNVQKCAELAIYNPSNETCTPDGKAALNPNVKNANYKNLLANKGSNAAMVVGDPNNGQVLAMVGSYSFSVSQVNVATSPRQPGSSMKPYVYATLFGKNMAGCLGKTKCDTYGAGSVLDDTPKNFAASGPAYTPHDFNGSCEVCGPITVRSALDGSLNIPAVHALQLAGIPQSIATAHAMGITTLNNDPNSYGLSLVLGSGEVTLADHVNAYESFANGGLHYAPSMTLKIYDSKGRTIEDNTKPPTPKKALDPQVAYLIANILSDSNARKYIFLNDLSVNGHNGGPQLGQGVAIKTGTTESYRDAWTMGFTPSLVAGVWTGNNDDTPMTNQAADIAAPFFRNFMNVMLYDKPMETFTKPAGLQFLPNSGPARRESASSDYFPKWYKARALPMVNIDKVSGLLATSCTPPLAIEQEPDSGITQSDNVHDCNDTKPQVQLQGATGGGPYNISVNVTLGTFGTTKPGIGSAQLQVYFDDQIISTQNISASGTYTIPTYTPSSTGSHTFKAVITDTGLYQATDTATVNVTSTGSEPSGFMNADPSNGSPVHVGVGQTSGNVQFTWQSDPNATNYQLFMDDSACGPPVTILTATCNVSGLLIKHKWYVGSASDNQSTTRWTFTLQP